MTSQIIPSRLRIAGAASVALLILAAASNAQAGVAPSEHTQRILLSFDEQNLPDSARAALFALVARLAPRNTWQRIAARANDAKETTLSKLFGYWKTPKYDTTTQVLVDVIDSANGRRSWTSGVLSPPVPVRGDTLNKYGATRVYDVESGRYGSFVRNASTRLSRALFASDSAPIRLPDLVDSPIRNVSRTIIRVPVSDATAELLQLIPPGVTAMADGGTVNLTLSGRESRTDCVSVGDILVNSPYFAIARRRLATLDIAALARRADSVPLTVLDWDFGSAGGHGAKVLSVVNWVLDTLDLSQLRRGVKPFELNPSVRRDSVVEFVREFAARLPKQQRDNLEREIDAAPAWIRDFNPRPNSDTYQVREIVLLALLGKALQNDEQWANMSFSVENAAFELRVDPIMQGTRVLGLLAVGNRRRALAPGTALQGAAGNQKATLINVTGIDTSGRVLGDTSNTQKGLWVTLAAPWCGYRGGLIAPTDSGTSFSSPFVAVSSWLARLIDLIPIAEMRQALIMASRPVSGLWSHLESGGVFDPALLLALPTVGMHALDTRGGVSQLARVTIDVRGHNIARPAHGEQTQFDGPRNGLPTATFWVERCPQGYCASERRLTNRGVLEITSYAIDSLRVVLTSDAGSTIIDRPEQFLRDVRAVWY